MSVVLLQASIHPLSFKLSKQEFFDQPESQMTIPGATPVITTPAIARARVNFNGLDNPQADQLWAYDFLQDLKVELLKKTNIITNYHFAYQIIPPEKPDIIYLLSPVRGAYNAFSAGIVSMEGKAATERIPTNSISQIKDAKFTKLDINNVGFNMENEEAFIDMIRTQKILKFPTQIIRTQSNNFSFRGFVSSG
ncbi:MAG: hypothetical protein EZS28_034102 [Streblomastix strix]|uniref:Uncharacterized protein n=1 Tax=Streblomastix strix TaxID=222440 RepID=A0A5J4UJZ6_9EUKA|nr:MAG: hypothetical protein EZS28_034102 [Streblomastix strix]